MGAHTAYEYRTYIKLCVQVQVQVQLHAFMLNGACFSFSIAAAP